MWSWSLTWGCIPELSRNCMDMTNSSNTYLGIIAGAIIGGIVSDKQDYTLSRIEQLENYNEKLLEKFFDLNKKIDSLIEGQ
jgi:hypothetical protein